MTALLYGSIYFCLLGSLVACAFRARGYAKAPLHLRWELYPVPQHAAQRARAMAVEVLFLKGLWQFNRKLWIWSYAFHLGLYLAVCGILISVAGVAIPSAGLQVACTITGSGACILIPIGAIGLLIRRLTDSKLRAYTTPGDIFNLCFFLATVALLLWSKASSACVSATDLVRGLAAFDTSLKIPAAQAAAVAAAALLVLYIPLTHMAHFIAKYFTYHSVRWDDRPNRNEPALEARIAEYLTYRPNWSATHVGATDGATWAEISTKGPGKGSRK